MNNSRATGVKFAQNEQRNSRSYRAFAISFRRLTGCHSQRSERLRRRGLRAGVTCQAPNLEQREGRRVYCSRERTLGRAIRRGHPPTLFYLLAVVFLINRTRDLTSEVFSLKSQENVNP